MKILKNQVDWNVVPNGMTMLFFGTPKTGKTTTACNWSDKGTEGVLLIDTDQGGDFIDGINRIVCTSFNVPERPVMKDQKHMLDKRGMPAYEIIPPEERGYVFTSGPNKGQPMPVYSIAEIINYLQDEISSNRLPYDTIVIDTIDEMVDWVDAEVCEELGTNAMGEAEFGKDWALSRNKAANVISMLKNMLKKAGINLILISHAKTAVMLKNKIQLGPDMPKGLAKKIMGMCELIAYIYIKEGTTEAVMSFAGYDEVLMGSRLKPLAHQEIKFDYKEFINKITSYKGD